MEGYMNRKTKKMEKNKNRKYILVIWILAVVILLFGIIFTGKRIWNKYRDDIINQQEEQMLIISDSLAGNLEETVNGYALDLKAPPPTPVSVPTNIDNNKLL